MKILSKVYVVAVFLLLYIPILVLILFSFNNTANTGAMTGLSLYWYKELFSSPDTFTALKNTLVLALSSAAISTVIGTAATVGIAKMKRRSVQKGILSITNIPMMNPEIVTGISMMLLFVFVGTMLGLEDKLSFVTLLIAHVTFCLPYVILSVRPHLLKMDRALPEAARDLGCTPLQSFFKVELPCIMSGVVSGFIMAFTLSLDDFVISYFNSGSTAQNLSVTIYSMTKKPVTPEINALSTLMFGAVLILLVVVNIRQVRDLNKQKERR